MIAICVTDLFTTFVILGCVLLGGFIAWFTDGDWDDAGAYAAIAFVVALAVIGVIAKLDERKSEKRKEAAEVTEEDRE